ncbi:uncharacterized protein LOC129920547 [Episyrphus balteatus]|uniref:uncharacterized protein LOC129920547 n=1 Tax=Episyrphus balteatus TaxID=286459 RepID=UPI00248513FC|nr:uncharacterized protein LOC129920547 [Episyrphus balteatus]
MRYGPQFHIFSLLISGLFYFSEGKPCPEKIQPHKSRCDVYFKCVDLPSMNHIWIPEKCEQGLIFDPDLRMCVLPGENWECNLEEFIGISETNNDENILFGSSGDEVSKRSLDLEEEFVPAAGTDEIDSESEEEIDDSVKESDYITVDDSESGLVSERDFESSGDGVGGSDYILLDTLTPEKKTNEESSADLEDKPAAPTKVDPNLTAHLQRLTQLIDGLKQTYQNKDSASADLRPDQLNAFLAHYNIKAQLDSIDPAKEAVIPQQNQSEPVESISSNSSQLDPETKVILTNQLPNSFNPHPQDGYSNSQIVVNKPEGSVLFTLGNQPQDTIIDHRYDPKISEDTLKTVLQLSKQMLDSQDVRRVVPSSAYYPQVVQPIYLPPPLPQYANNAFNQHQFYENTQYDKPTYYGASKKPEKSGTTIIHNNVNVVPSDDQVDSYGQKLHSYPPFPTYQYSSEGSSEVQDHNLGNRYENNQLVTVRPNKGYSHYQPTTTPSRPFIKDSGSTLFDYYTPSPHLDETNVNSVFQMEKYPTLNIGSYSGRPPTKSHKRPVQLFPAHIDPSKVKIRPNSQKLESMEQDSGDDNNVADEEDENDRSSYGSSDDDDNQSETYNHYNANKQITASQLAHYVGQLTGSKAPISSPSQQIYGSDLSAFQQQNEDESQLGGYPGNLLAYDLFKEPSSYDNSKPDASSCPVGIRQPNTTECTRYYVCSREDGRVMQYSCPSFTAFNPQTRICDAQYYSICHPRAVISRYTISENQRVQLEAIKALHDAKRIREQALRAQNIALRLRLGEHDKNHHASTTAAPQHQQYSSEVLSNFLQNAIDSNSLMSSGSSDKDSSYSSSVSQRPDNYISSSSSSGGNRKRKYYCKEGDKVADQTSIYNYFVCYKNSQGVMKGHKMKCSEGLLFCPMTSMCTLPKRCS